ncbi:hypothetical protein C5O00_11070 [Pukyongia salina]|uniref:Uncharacterized protein n=1 Tax=Pukyongia salina TaxID=2094025 RepID=A0A2S0HYD8_9FLAO|nr:hypothetical protein C5O00_11070 [Pukyongia salina]
MQFDYREWNGVNSNYIADYCQLLCQLRKQTRLYQQITEIVAEKEGLHIPGPPHLTIKLPAAYAALMLLLFLHL